jgi:hypothetical protein
MNWASDPSFTFQVKGKEAGLLAQKGGKNKEKKTAGRNRTVA